MRRYHVTNWLACFDSLSLKGIYCRSSKHTDDRAGGATPYHGQEKINATT